MQTNVSPVQGGGELFIQVQSACHPSIIKQNSSLPRHFVCPLYIPALVHSTLTQSDVGGPVSLCEGPVPYSAQ